ncbi:HPP family protein [Marinimicrobium sp. ARAG 43.8]|uniref:HPP family protein n=1 Tax=Marinimicrobium sp. ARAG 43.8 TaxID=3418719 RepID=UPI003CF5A878
MFLSFLWRELRASLGIERNTTSHGEKLISAAGAFLGILAVYLVSHWYLPDTGALLMLASMGASAVLLFAVPHGALSQPWALLGGHLVSAAVGVTCQILLPDSLWTPALAVGVAVGVMYYLRCIHPPGGATALAAVIGGAGTHELGYYYLLMPVLLNALTLLALAVLFNGLFAWRRYPGHWSRRPAHKPKAASASEGVISFSQEDLAAAMMQLNSYVDVTTEELIELMELAREHAERQVEHPAQIIVGRFYSNGEVGHRWCVRQVVDEGDAARKDQVIYRHVAGMDVGETGLCERETFRQWARFEVVKAGGRWIKR